MKYLQKFYLLILLLLLFSSAKLYAQLPTCEELYTNYNTLNATCISSLGLDEKISYLNQLLALVATMEQLDCPQRSLITMTDICNICEELVIGFNNADNNCKATTILSEKKEHLNYALQLQALSDQLGCSQVSCYSCLCNNIFDPQYTYINISSPQNTVTVGSTVQLEAEIVSHYYYPSDDDPNKVLLEQILQGTIQWTSLTPEIATVDQNGLVTVLMHGSITVTAVSADIPDIAGTIELNNVCDNLSSIDVTEWTTQEDRAMQRMNILRSYLNLCVDNENFTENVQEATAIIFRDWYFGTPGGGGIKQIIEQSSIDPETFLDNAISQLNNWYGQLYSNDLSPFEPFEYQFAPITCTNSSVSLCNNLEEIAVCAAGQIYEALKIAVTNANTLCENSQANDDDAALAWIEKACLLTIDYSPLYENIIDRDELWELKTCGIKGVAIFADATTIKKGENIHLKVEAIDQNDNIINNYLVGHNISVQWESLTPLTLALSSSEIEINQIAQNAGLIKLHVTTFNNCKVLDATKEIIVINITYNNSLPEYAIDWYPPGIYGINYRGESFSHSNCAGNARESIALFEGASGPQFLMEGESFNAVPYGWCNQTSPSYNCLWEAEEDGVNYYICTISGVYPRAELKDWPFRVVRKDGGPIPEEVTVSVRIDYSYVIDYVITPYQSYMNFTLEVYNNIRRYRKSNNSLIPCSFGDHLTVSTNGNNNILYLTLYARVTANNFDGGNKSLRAVFDPHFIIAPYTPNAEDYEVLTIQTLESTNWVKHEYISLIDIINGVGDVKGIISGTITVDASPIQGIIVDLSDQNGNIIAESISDDNGNYTFADVAIGDYSVGIIEPLGYNACNNPITTTVTANQTSTVDFCLNETVIQNNALGMGYWKHQFNVYVSGNGTAQETQEALTNYIDLIHNHYTTHYNIFENVLSFQEWLQILKLTGNQPMVKRAKQHLATTLFNLVSQKIGQYTVVTLDSRTVGDVIDYVSQLILDGNNSNDELAKNLAEKVNEQQMIASGIVPIGSTLFKIAGENEERLTYELANNYPNPFNPTTRIKYEIANNENVRLKVYDILGKEVANLVDAQKEAGRYEILFDASNLASGIYYYQLQAGSFVQTRKMILLK